MKKNYIYLFLFLLIGLISGLFFLEYYNKNYAKKKIVTRYSYLKTEQEKKENNQQTSEKQEKSASNNKDKQSLKLIEKKLLSPEDGKIYWGAFPDFGGPEDKVSKKRIEQFNKLVGKNIAWAYFSNNWGRDGIKFPLQKVEIIYSSGAVPFVRMMPRKYFDTAYDKTFSLQKIIEGKFDKELHKYAQDVKNFQKPILIDFGVEMNGDWFPWGGALNGGAVKTKYGDPQKADGPERFVDAYRHIINIFRFEKVNNVTWFFHPDIYSYPEHRKWNDPKYFYPGDDYIDWIGISVYGPQTPAEDYWDTFSKIMKERQNKILEISQKKPIALLEFGVTDHHPLGKKSQWLKGAFAYILNQDSLLQFKAISYWHENWEEDDDLWATLRLDSSSTSLNTFKNLISNEKFISTLKFSN